jgi:hypothetical protein
MILTLPHRGSYRRVIHTNLLIDWSRVALAVVADASSRWMTKIPENEAMISLFSAFL